MISFVVCSNNDYSLLRDEVGKLLSFRGVVHITVFNASGRDCLWSCGEVSTLDEVTFSRLVRDSLLDPYGVREDRCLGYLLENGTMTDEEMKTMNEYLRSGASLRVFRLGF